MPYVDYLVATGKGYAFGWVLRKLAALVADGEQTKLYGFRCKKLGPLVVGLKEDTRDWIVSASGSEAHGIATMLTHSNIAELSIARIDIQETVKVPDADMIITLLNPRPVYKAVNVKSINERGNTLYIGSAMSRARMRIYNKSAEEGIYPEGGGEYLRVEIQLRNEYADKAMRMIADGQIDDLLSFWIDKMLQQTDAERVREMVKLHKVEGNPFKEQRDDNWVERRKQWIETVVLSAIRALVLASPGYLDYLIARLQEMKELLPDDLFSN